MDIKYLYGNLNSLISYLTCAIWTLVPTWTFELPKLTPVFYFDIYSAIWTFELPKLTPVFYFDIYSAIWTFELPIRMIGSNQWIYLTWKTYIITKTMWIEKSVIDNERHVGLY